MAINVGEGGIQRHKVHHHSSLRLPFGNGTKKEEEKQSNERSVKRSL